MGNVDIGIDLGTANVIITFGKKGVVINEPSVVAYDKKRKEVIAVGEEAYKMIGRTPGHIIAIKPLKDGVISDNVMTDLMIKEYIKRLSNSVLVRPRVIICVPSCVTGVEARAIAEAAVSAGARKVCLIEEPIAALLGSGADISKPGGHMVVDIGGGTTDVAVISLFGIVSSLSVKYAGNKIDEAIVDFIRKKYTLQIGEKTAETIKKQIADVYEPTGEKKMLVKGLHLVSRLPQSIEVSDADVYQTVHSLAMEIVGAIKSEFERTPPELAGDILQRGIVLTGGGACIGNIDMLISKETGAPCRIAENPIECVANGISKSFAYIGDLLDGFERINSYKLK